MDISKLDQDMALMADSFPPLWRRLYLNCVQQGFTAVQALELVKTYILSMNIKYGHS